MAEGLQKLQTLNTAPSGVPGTEGYSPDISDLVEDLMYKEGFDPQVHLLESIMKGEQQVQVDTSATENAINLQVEAMQALQEESQGLIQQLTQSGDIQQLASRQAEEANLGVVQAELPRQLQLEEELAGIMEEQRNSAAELNAVATGISRAVQQDLAVVDSANDVTFLDFLKNPVAAVRDGLAGDRARRSARINSQKLVALQGLQQFQANAFTSQADAIATQAKLRRKQDEGMYMQQAVKTSLLRQATLNRQLTMEDTQALGQAFGLSRGILDGLVSSLNAQISAGNVRGQNIDRMLEAARQKQLIENQKRIQKEAARNESSRAAVNESLLRGYTALGIPVSDPTTLVEQFATSRELGLVNPLQEHLLGQYVIGQGINSSTVFNSPDPIGTYEQLRSSNPDLISPAMDQLMNTVRTDMRDANGNKLEPPIPGSSPEDIRAAENAHFKSWYASVQSNYNNMFDTFGGSLHSPSDITDYAAVEGFPSGMEELFRKMKVNTTSGQSYFQELAAGLAASGETDVERMAIAAAAISKSHFDSIQAGTGISVPEMIIPSLNGDARNPAIWHTRLTMIRARAKAAEASKKLGNAPLGNF